MEEKTYTIKEVADILGMSISNLYIMHKNGIIKIIKPYGKRSLILESQLMLAKEYLAKKTKEKSQHERAVKSEIQRNRDKWRLTNKLLNTARKYAGIPLIPPTENPYIERIGWVER